MNKREFATELSGKTGLTITKAVEITNAAIDILSERMVAGDRVQFSGFGSFETKDSPRRKARNPKTGEEVIIPAGYRPAFKAGKELREKINDAHG